MADKFSVLIKYKYLEYIENAKLSGSDSWLFMKGLIEYDKTGKEPKFKNPKLTGLFAVLKCDLDENREKWNDRVVINRENGKRGGRPPKTQKTQDNQTEPEKPNGLLETQWGAKKPTETQANQKNPQKPDLDLDSEFDLDSVSETVSGSEINSTSGSAESSDNKTPSPKPKKLPLRERDPENDMERVEKTYWTNWDMLYSQGRVKTPDPITNWGQVRKLLKNHFVKLKPDQIIQAINSGMADEFSMKAGYSLSTMLSAAVLNRLVNAVAVSKHQQEKLTLE